MRHILKILLTILAVLVVLVVGAYAYLGGFHSVVIEEKEMGPFHFAYRDMVGSDLSKVKEITTSLDVELRKNGFTFLQPFDVYYPEGGGEIGFVVAEKESVLLSSVDASIKTKQIPEQHYMVATFPFKNLFSYIIGFIKVDPVLKAHRKKNGYRKTWAATRHNGDNITYLQPIVKELLAPQ